MVLPNFVRAAISGQPITVFGTGEQSRCFAHVTDVAESVFRLISTPAAYGEVFNIGNDEEVSINRLAELVRDAAGSSSPIVHVPYEEAYAEGFEDMARRVPNVSRLEGMIGFRPNLPLQRIIADVLQYERAGTEVLV
jgi:UDP-glucose 4-epimerase